MRTTQVFDDVLEAGVSGEIIQHDGTKWARTTVAPGSTPPGGSPNEIQFNNAGSFDGASGIEFDGTDLQIAGSQGIYFRGEAIGILSPSTGVLTIAGDSQANVIGDIVHFADSSGNGLFRLETQATPVNYLTVKNSATATELAIQATGTDSNIGIKFIPKGSAGVYIGDFATGIDYALWFLGETTSGTFKWMEDEDYFQFQDGMLFNSAEELYFRATTQRIYSPSSNTLYLDAPTLSLNPNNAGDITLGDGTQRDMYPNTDLKIDLGKSSNRFNEAWIYQLHVQQSVANVSSPPTDAELDSAFGTPATLGRGFIGTVDDNDGDTVCWLCMTTDASWYYVATTKAV